MNQQKLIEKYNKKKQWFIDRIGKKIYRCKLKCKCIHCQEGGEKGILIIDENHAIYLTDVSIEMNIKYFDNHNEIKK